MRKLSERPFIPRPLGADATAFMGTFVSRLTQCLGEIVQRSNNSITVDGEEPMVRPFVAVAVAKAALLAAPFLATDWLGGVVYVTNDVGGATLAFSDGTNWRRVQDRNVVS